MNRRKTDKDLSSGVDSDVEIRKTLHFRFISWQLFANELLHERTATVEMFDRKFTNRLKKSTINNVYCHLVFFPNKRVY